MSGHSHRRLPQQGTEQGAVGPEPRGPGLHRPPGGPGMGGPGNQARQEWLRQRRPPPGGHPPRPPGRRDPWGGGVGEWERAVEPEGPEPGQEQQPAGPGQQGPVLADGGSAGQQGPVPEQTTAGPEGAAPSLDEVRAGTAMEPGAAGESVAQVQHGLSRLGFEVQNTGVLGPTTEETVRTFQAAYGMEQTGRVDAATLELMDRALEASITLEDFQAIAPNVSDDNARLWLPYLNASMLEAGITDDTRKAAYLAQLAHETDGFNTLEEYASGADYEGRSDLGNTQRGDGRRFKGRGAIQLTGRANYTSASQRLGVDLVNNPELAAEPEYAFRVSADYWSQHGLNDLADRGDFEGITDVINYYDPESRRRSRRAYHRTATTQMEQSADVDSVDQMSTEIDPEWLERVREAVRRRQA